MADPITVNPDDVETESASPAQVIDVDPADVDLPSERKSGFVDKANQFLYGVNERLGAIPRAIEDIAAGNVNIAGHKIPLPWGGGETARPVSGAMKEAFYPTDAVTRGEKIARAAGSYVPDTLAMLATSGGSLGATGAAKLAEPISLAMAPASRALAQQVVEATSPGVRRLAQSAGGIREAVEAAPEALRRGAAHLAVGNRERLAAAPLATLTAETVSGAGAGAAGEIYRGTPGEHSALGEMGSELAGGMAPALAALPGRALSTYWNNAPGPKLIRKGAEIAAEHIPPDMLERFPALAAAAERRVTKRRDQAMRDLKDEFGAIGDPESQAGLAEAERLRGVIGPAFTPTLGEATGMTSALTTQRAIESKASGADLDAIAADFRRRNKSVADFAMQAAPAAPGTAVEQAQAPAAAAARMVSRERGALDEQLARVGNEETSTLAAYLPEADRAKAGEALRDRLLANKAETSARMSKMFEDLIPVENQFVPFAKLQSRIAALKPSLFADTSDLGPTVKKIMDWQPGAENRPTFSDVKFLRENLGSEKRVAERAGDRQLARRLGDAIGEVDDFLETDWAKGLKGDVAAKYADFRKTYKADYIDRFEKGASRDAKRLGGDNDYRTPNEDVAFEYWTPGGITEARQFKTTFGDDPVAKKALYAVALDDLRKKAAPNGQWNPAAYKRWINANEANLKEFPDLQEHVGTLGGAIDALSARRAEIVGRQSEIADHVLTKTLNRDPDKIAEIALSNPTSARTLAQEMTPAEREMTGRLAWDRVVKSGASADDLRRLLAERRAALSVWLKPDQLKSLDDAAKAWAMLERSHPPSGTATEADALGRVGKTIGTGIPQLASRIFALKSGRTGMEYTMVDLMVRAGIAMNKREADALARQAIYDPQFAKELARYVGQLSGPGVKPAIPKPLKAYVGAVLARPRNQEQPDQAPQTGEQTPE